jgi:predicted metal-binding membrane protein
MRSESHRSGKVRRLGGGELDEPGLKTGSDSRATEAGNRRESLALGALELVVRRQDAIALAGVVLTVAAAWAYLLGSSGISGPEMDGMEMPGPAPESWSWREGVLLFGMWAVMMVAMMLPSAAPMILLFSRIGVTRSERGGKPVSVLLFALGYLLVWWAFSALAALVQWQLHSAAALSADMRAASPVAAGVLLIVAGVYQWLPSKQGCLRQCRSPFGFLATSWREGHRGAVVMGVTHGTFCLGCCWMLMALLFAAGVMNLVWVAAISGLVLVEKLMPGGAAVARAAGIIFVCAGIALIL